MEAPYQRTDASGLIDIEPRASLGAGETLQAKNRFEKWMWELVGVLANECHSDHGIFDAPLCMEDCQEKSQKQMSSGIGSKDQNSHAEHDIQTIMH